MKGGRRMKIHLVYRDGFESLKLALEENGHIIKWDLSLEQFALASQSNGVDPGTDIVLMDGTAGCRTKQESFEFLKQARTNLPDMRFIVQLPTSESDDKEWLNKLFGLSIYDIHFVDEFTLDDVEEWLVTKKNLTDYEYAGEPLQGEIQSDVSFQPNEEVEDEEKQLVHRLSKLRTKKEKETIFQYRAFAAKVITVASMKGGIGKTDISLNLACAIQEHTKSRVVVVDFDFPYGGISQALQFTRTVHIGDWLMKPGEVLTEEGVHQRVIEHEGLHIIPMAVNIKDSLQFQRLQSEMMIDTLRKYYDVIIVDTSGFSEAAIVAIGRSTEVILLTGHDTVAISNTSAYRGDIINYFGNNPDKITLFINMVPKEEDITLQDIAETFEDNEIYTPVIGYAPYDDTVRQCRNKGLLIYHEKPLHSFSMGIDMILKSLDVVPEEVLNQKKIAFVKSSRSNGLANQVERLMGRIRK